MGKWDRRRIPRRNYDNRKYRDYDYVEPPPSPPSPHHSQSNPPAIQDESESPWEIEFCKSVGVRWKKVVNSKKFMHCHDNIIKWDDCAAKEAFLSAKQRYWEKINRLPNETPLEDPNLYIDNDLDWNPYIDPVLMSELDKSYFNPDEVGNRGKFFKKERNQSPECYPTPEVGDLNDASTTWGQNTKLKNSKDDDDNPWEQKGVTVDESSRSNMWKDCGNNESWDWKQKPRNNNQRADINNDSLNYTNGGWQNVGHGSEKARIDNHWKKPNNYTHFQQHSVYSGSRTGSSWERDRREQRVFDSRDFQESYGGGNSFQSSCRKREGGSFQRPQRYNKIGRFHGRGN